MALDGPQEPDLSGGEQPVHGRGGKPFPPTHAVVLRYQDIYLKTDVSHLLQP